MKEEAYANKNESSSDEHHNTWQHKRYYIYHQIPCKLEV